jgi:hypothetical protein
MLKFDPHKFRQWLDKKIEKDYYNPDHNSREEIDDTVEYYLKNLTAVDICCYLGEFLVESHKNESAGNKTGTATGSGYASGSGYGSGGY